MQLALFFQALRMAHNIWVTAWHNFQASRNSSLPSLWGKHDPQHWILYSPYAYIHSFSICPEILSDSSRSLQPPTPSPWEIMDQVQYCSKDYPMSQVSYTFFHTKLYKESSPRMLAVHYYKQILPSVNNLPTLLVCPSHTCEACLRVLDSLSICPSVWGW